MVINSVMSKSIHIKDVIALITARINDAVRHDFLFKNWACRESRPNLPLCYSKK